MQSNLPRNRTLVYLLQLTALTFLGILKVCLVNALTLTHHHKLTPLHLAPSPPPFSPPLCNYSTSRVNRDLMSSDLYLHSDELFLPLGTFSVRATYFVPPTADHVHKTTCSLHHKLPAIQPSVNVHWL